MKILVIISIALFSCGVTKQLPNHQEQARLTSCTRIADNKGILKLTTVTGKEVIWYNKVRGLGKAKWFEGNRYSVHFDSNNKIVKITENE